MPEEEQPAKQEPKRTEEHREKATWQRSVGPKKVSIRFGYEGVTYNFD